MKRSHLSPTVPLFVAAVLLIAVPSGRAGDWPGWRGPTGVGVSDEKDLPLTWGGKTKENVLWTKTIDGQGYSSPVVWGDHVFVTTMVTKKDAKEQVPENYVVCYKADDGTELWRTLVPPGNWPAEKPGSNTAIPTPVIDGERVYAWFGDDKIGVLAALNFKGEVQWRFERLGPFSLNPGLCSSPVLYKDTVIQLCDQGGGKGFLVALDKKTGDVRWEQKRKKESHNNCTPVLIEAAGKPQLVVNASDALQGVDPDNGELLWWCNGPLGFGDSAAFGGGLVFAQSGAGGDALAVCVDPSGRGDVTKTNVKWQLPKAPGYYGSPVVAGDYVLRAYKPGFVSCRSLATGEEVYSERLEGVSTVCSPVVSADGLVYFVSGGKSFVVKPGPKLDVVGRGQLDLGDDGPSAAISGGRLFLKSSHGIACIGKK